MGLSGGAIAGIVIGCVVFVVLKTACEYSPFSLMPARIDLLSSGVGTREVVPRLSLAQAAAQVCFIASSTGTRGVRGFWLLEEAGRRMWRKLMPPH